MLYLEPWRAKAFPDRKRSRRRSQRRSTGLLRAGGFVSVSTGSAPDGNAIPIPKKNADLAMDAAACIGCGACVAACPNAAAALFTGRQRSAISACCPRASRSATSGLLNMVAQVKQEMFGSCTNIGECEAVCPKEIKLEVIARMNRDYLRASWTERGDASARTED